MDISVFSRKFGKLGAKIKNLIIPKKTVRIDGLIQLTNLRTIAIERYKKDFLSLENRIVEILSMG